MKILKVTSTIIFLVTILNCRVGLGAEDKAHYKQTSLSNPIREKMDLIDPKDLVYLEDLFRNLFCKDSFAYTLFGPKPMTIDGCSLAYYDRGVKLKTRMVIDFLGWKAWEKYSHLFPSQKFCFITPEFKDKPKYLGYRIINKKSCEEVITKYLPIFQECTERDKTIQEILDSICSSSFLDSYQNKKKYITCLGILFGYGEKNSRACERRSILFIQALYHAPYHLEGLNEKMKNRQEYFHVGLQQKEFVDGLEQPISIQSVIEGLNELNQTYRPIALVDKHYLCPIGDVRCAGMNEDPETKDLQVQYESVCQKLVDIYNSENFLEIVLTQLSS